MAAANRSPAGGASSVEDQVARHVTRLGAITNGFNNAVHVLDATLALGSHVLVLDAAAAVLLAAHSTRVAAVMAAEVSSGRLPAAATACGTGLAAGRKAHLPWVTWWSAARLVAAAAPYDTLHSCMAKLAAQAASRRAGSADEAVTAHDVGSGFLQLLLEWPRTVPLTKPPSVLAIVPAPPAPIPAPAVPDVAATRASSSVPYESATAATPARGAMADDSSGGGSGDMKRIVLLRSPPAAAAAAASTPLRSTSAPSHALPRGAARHTTTPLLPSSPLPPPASVAKLHGSPPPAASTSPRRPAASVAAAATTPALIDYDSLYPKAQRGFLRRGAGNGGNCGTGSSASSGARLPGTLSPETAAAARTAAALQQTSPPPPATTAAATPASPSPTTPPRHPWLGALIDGRSDSDVEPRPRLATTAVPMPLADAPAGDA